MYRRVQCFLGTAQPGSGVLRRRRTLASLAPLGELPLCVAPPRLLLCSGPAHAPLAVSVVQPSGQASPALLVSSGGGNKMVRPSLDLPGALGRVGLRS